MLRRLFVSRRLLNQNTRLLTGAFSIPSGYPRRVRCIESDAKTNRIRGVSTTTMASSNAAEDDATASSPVRYCDIGANLCDPMFQGLYGGKRYHDPDLASVLSRAASAGVGRIIVTAGSLAESEAAAEMSAASREEEEERGAGRETPSSSSSPVELYCSAGVHPTRAGELVQGGGGEGGGEGEEGERGSERRVDAAAVQRLRAILEKWTSASSSSDDPRRRVCVALGETGLDYARLQFCDAETQRVAFGAQLDLAAELDGRVPLFLHLRDAGDDFLAALSEPRFRRRSSDPSSSPSPPSSTPVRLRGVVHSFDGGVDLMRRLLSLSARRGAAGRDLFIGINGCSLRDERGLDVAREVPLDRLLLETDAPWCDLRPTHASASQGGFDLKRFDEAEGIVWRDKKKLASVKGGGGGGGGDGENKVVMIKGRNEPSRIAAVAAAVAAARGVPVEVVAKAAWENSERLFFS